MVKMDNDKENEYEKYKNDMTKSQFKKFKREFKNFLSDKELDFKSFLMMVKEKTKENTDFKSKINSGYSAYCSNNLHSHCNGHFTTNKNKKCLCPCHKKIKK